MKGGANYCLAQTGKEISMDVLAVVGSLFTLFFAVVLVVGKLAQNADRRVVRVPVLIERINASTRSIKNDRPEHIL